MIDQRDFRMPKTGEGWRHYKGGLYTIVGIAVDDKGDVMVVYTEADWSLVQLPPLFTQPLARFLQFVEKEKQRFTCDREVGFDDRCPYIRERQKYAAPKEAT